MLHLAGMRRPLLRQHQASQLRKVRKGSMGKAAFHIVQNPTPTAFTPEHGRLQSFGSGGHCTDRQYCEAYAQEHDVKLQTRCSAESRQPALVCMSVRIGMQKFEHSPSRRGKCRGSEIQLTSGALLCPARTRPCLSCRVPSDTAKPRFLSEADSCQTLDEPPSAGER